MTSEQHFVSLFGYRLFPVAIHGRNCFLCITSLNKHLLLLPMPPAIACRLAFGHLRCSLPEILSIHHITTCMQTLKTTSSGQAATDTGRESKQKHLNNTTQHFWVLFVVWVWFFSNLDSFTQQQTESKVDTSETWLKKIVKFYLCGCN